MKRPEKNDGKRKDEPPGLASSVIVGGAAILFAVGAAVGYALGGLMSPKETPERVVTTEAAPAGANESASECVLCLSNQPQYACLPCGHLCICSACTAPGGTAPRGMTACPVCRRALASSQLTRIYQ